MNLYHYYDKSIGHEILEVINKYGLPQAWNDDGRFGPERYIEVHVWSDEVISRYKKSANTSSLFTSTEAH